MSHSMSHAMSHCHARSGLLKGQLLLRRGDIRSNEFDIQSNRPTPWARRPSWNNPAIKALVCKTLQIETSAKHDRRPKHDLAVEPALPDRPEARWRRINHTLDVLIVEWFSRPCDALEPRLADLKILILAKLVV